jgi:biotin carboxyl carrier protein
MTNGIRPLGAVVVGAVLAAALVALYLSHQRERHAERVRDAPVVAPSRVEQSAAAVLVAVDSSDADRIGLETAPLAGISRVPEERLMGEVIAEPERVALVRAPVAGRLTVPAGARWPGLGDIVTAGHELVQVSDARPIASPISGIVTKVGAQPGAIVEAGQDLLQVVDQSRPLVRVAWSDRAGSPPRPTILLGPAGGTTRVHGRLVGPAPEADPATRRAAYLYRADRAWPGAAPGTPVVAFVSGQGSHVKAARGEVIVPDRAVVQWEGLAWAYVRREPGRFERVRVPTDRPTPGGWIIDGALTANDTVVVTGAQELLSEEFRAHVTVGDESGE